MQDYPSPIGTNGKARAGIPTYLVTLLWYPRIRKLSDSWSLGSCEWAMAEESLLPARGLSPGFQRYSLPPEVPTVPAASTTVNTAKISKAMGAHKRQISEAIPRNERENGELSRPGAALVSQEGTRKSVRARKPTQVE